LSVTNEHNILTSRKAARNGHSTVPAAFPRRLPLSCYNQKFPWQTFIPFVLSAMTCSEFPPRRSSLSPMTRSPPRCRNATTLPAPTTWCASFWVAANLTITITIKSLAHLFSPYNIDRILFTVNKGDLLGIIDPNGAGKGTLFKCMLGLIEDYRGQISIFDNGIRKNKKVLQKVGYIPKIRSIEQNFLQQQKKLFL